MTDDALDRSRVRAVRVSAAINTLCQVVNVVAVVVNLRTGNWTVAGLSAVVWMAVAFARGAMRGYEQTFRLQRARLQDERALAALMLQKLHESGALQFREIDTEDVQRH